MRLPPIRVLRALFVAWVLLDAVPVRAEVTAVPGTRIENLSAALRKAGIWLPPVPEFEVAAGKTWLLNGQNEIVDLASGARVFPRGFVVHSFARTRQGSVVTITENVLGGYFRGLFVPTTKLPYGNMRVAAGPGETVLIYGGPDDSQLLISYDGERYSTLLRFEEPVGAVSHVGQRVFVGVGSKLLTAKPGEAPALVFMLPEGAPITGIAVDAQTGTTYLATAGGIYALREGIASRISRGLGGKLQWRDGALYVLDPAEGLFARLSFADPRTVAPAAK